MVLALRVRCSQNTLQVWAIETSAAVGQNSGQFRRTHTPELCILPAAPFLQHYCDANSFDTFLGHLLVKASVRGKRVLK